MFSVACSTSLSSPSCLSNCKEHAVQLNSMSAGRRARRASPRRKALVFPESRYEHVRLRTKAQARHRKPLRGAAISGLVVAAERKKFEHLVLPPPRQDPVFGVGRVVRLRIPLRCVLQPSSRPPRSRAGLSRSARLLLPQSLARRPSSCWAAALTRRACAYSCPQTMAPTSSASSSSDAEPGQPMASSLAGLPVGAQSPQGASKGEPKGLQDTLDLAVRPSRPSSCGSSPSRSVN